MEQAAVVFKALGDTTRLRIVHLLIHQQLCVCQIMESLSISQVKTSRHLAVLRQAGLVTSHKQAQWVWYQLAEQPLVDNPQFREYIFSLPGAEHDLESMQKLDTNLLCVPAKQD